MLSRFGRTLAYWRWYTASVTGAWPKAKIVLASPGYQVVLLHCVINEIPQWPVLSWGLRRFYSYLRYKYGIDLPLPLRFGDRLRIFHFGGVIINPAAVIGNDVDIMHGVTIGNDMVTDACPVVSDGCFLGVGCKVIGGVFLAQGTKVGANAVVVHSSHIAGQTLVGVPARPAIEPGAEL